MKAIKRLHSEIIYSLHITLSLYAKSNVQTLQLHHKLTPVIDCPRKSPFLLLRNHTVNHKMATKSSPAVPREERADIKSWIAELIPFIHTYNWIYDVQVTHLFKCKIWEKFPKEVGTSVVMHYHSPSFTCTIHHLLRV